jgi:two-component system, response regulator PdtaR
MAPSPRILIVDDDSVITHLIILMLQKKGCNIVGKFSTGEEALLKSAELNPDLVIVDIRLTGEMGGIATARYIFKLFQFPVIFIAGKEDENLLENAIFSEPYGILFKPFMDIELKSSVDLALYNHSIRKKTLGTYPFGEPNKIVDVNEVIIIMDLKGRIIFFNHYAAWFIDLPEKEILMNYWRDVLMLIDDLTGEELKDPIHDMARHGAVVIHDTNTAIVTKSGKRRKVGVLVQPVMDERGKTIVFSMKIKEKKI